MAALLGSMSEKGTRGFENNPWRWQQFVHEDLTTVLAWSCLLWPWPCILSRLPSSLGAHECFPSVGSLLNCTRDTPPLNRDFCRTGPLMTSQILWPQGGRTGLLGIKTNPLPLKAQFLDSLIQGSFYQKPWERKNKTPQVIFNSDHTVCFNH